MATANGEPSGLGGWLVLPAIGLFLTPVRVLAFAGTTYIPLFEDGTWEYLTTPGSEAYHHLWAPLLVFEIAGNLSFVVFDVILIVLFLSKSHRFPGLMIAFLLLNVFFVVFDEILGNFIPYLASMEDPEVYMEIARAVIGAMIWVPYFLVSKRVRNTFVKPGADKSTLEAFD